ncbi:hypothetical protein Tco_1125421 [Tanacetum coccineum]|uniref:Uncharacterized protein n=1 Tax=Tanacetum coccineum TaxID=301880 RepID=A0ABQ5JA42_9ASTR
MVMFDDDIKQSHLSEPLVIGWSQTSHTNPLDKYLNSIPQEGLSFVVKCCTGLPLRFAMLTESRNTTITQRTLPLLKTLQCSFCFFESKLTRLNPQTFSVGSGSTNLLAEQHKLLLQWTLGMSFLRPSDRLEDLCAAWATKIQTASKRATGANDSSKSTPSS